MKRLLILGAERRDDDRRQMRRNLDLDQSDITIVDQDNRHVYQPGCFHSVQHLPRTGRAQAAIPVTSRAESSSSSRILDAIDPDRNRFRLTDGRSSTTICS